MNAAIRAATMVTLAKGHRMLGIKYGYRGLLDEKMDEILAFADIGDYVYEPVKHYSSGMIVRASAKTAFTSYF